MTAAQRLDTAPSRRRPPPRTRPCGSQAAARRVRPTARGARVRALLPGPSIGRHLRRCRCRACRPLWETHWRPRRRLRIRRLGSPAAAGARARPLQTQRCLGGGGESEESESRTSGGLSADKVIDGAKARQGEEPAPSAPRCTVLASWAIAIFFALRASWDSTSPEWSPPLDMKLMSLQAHRRRRRQGSGKQKGAEGGKGGRRGVVE